MPKFSTHQSATSKQICLRVVLLKVSVWCRNVFWRYVRYQFPYKVRMYFKPKNPMSDDLPF